MKDWLADRLPDLSGWRDDANDWVARKTFSSADRLKLYEELAFLLGNNQPLGAALEHMISTARESGRKGRQETLWLKDILNGLNNGLSLDQAMSGWVPGGELAIIQSGLVDGSLPEALGRACTVVRGVAEMKSSVYSVMAYPFIQLTVVVALLLMIHDNFLPPLARMIPPERWEGAMWWLGTCANTVAVHGVWLGALFALFCAWAVWSLPGVTGGPRRIMDRLIPWSMYRDFQGAIFLLNMAALLGGNVKVLSALNQLALHASPWLQERLNAIRRRVSAGDHLGLALRNAGYGFPSEDAINKLRLLTASKTSDNSSVVIERYAVEMLHATIATMKTRLKRISVLFFALIGVFMGLLLFVIQDLNTLADQFGR